MLVWGTDTLVYQWHAKDGAMRSSELRNARKARPIKNSLIIS
jgi:hypothetical protein